MVKDYCYGIGVLLVIGNLPCYALADSRQICIDHYAPKYGYAVAVNLCQRDDVRRAFEGWVIENGNIDMGLEQVPAAGTNSGTIPINPCGAAGMSAMCPPGVRYRFNDGPLKDQTFSLPPGMWVPKGKF